MIKIDYTLKLKPNVDKYITKQVDKGLNEVANFIRNEAENYIRQHDIIDTEYLADHIIANNNEELRKIIYAEPSYAIFVEKKVRPHYPPIEPIYNWVWRKKDKFGIVPRTKRTNKEGITYYKEIMDVAWKVVNKIAKEGIDAQPFLSTALKEGEKNVDKIMKGEFKK